MSRGVKKEKEDLTTADDVVVISMISGRFLCMRKRR